MKNCRIAITDTLLQISLTIADSMSWMLATLGLWVYGAFLHSSVLVNNTLTIGLLKSVTPKQLSDQTLVD